jgi:hypothetical protein
VSRKLKENDKDFEDVIRREDGLVRHWMFLNGDTARLFSTLIAAFSAVLWCFLYFLGFGQGAVGMALLVVAFVSFFAWRIIGRELREYAENGWRKDRHSVKRDRIEICVAIGLWLFIFISFGAVILSQRHGR